ncbi:TetR/AcrR family transcriptional regulator [Leucobacter sp. USHLN153]|uniref:TetR/AcrR family transcriptional regulator n=1 Tax=Leucobacter sp. USHLN153 TaxID=3081268 RepID=UPI003016AF18
MVAQKRERKLPAERREEILAQAARIALSEGLERVTLRSVAEPLGVRPSLINHYFPSVDALIVSAFDSAMTRERARLFAGDGAPLDRLASFIARVENADGVALTRLWLNARNFARFNTQLALSLAYQESLDRQLLVDLLNSGVEAGEFACADTLAACIRIFVAIDGVGVYINNPSDFSHPVFTNYISDVTAWAVETDAVELRERVARAAATY